MPDTGVASARLAELRRRWDEEPTSRVFLQLAEEYRRVGETNAALEVLREGLDKNPGYVSAQVALGRCLLDTGKASEALKVLSQVLERDATQLVASKLLVEVHLRRSDALLARRQLDSYAALSPADPEIDSLRQRIDGLLLEDAAPSVAPGPRAPEPASLPTAGPSESPEASFTAEPARHSGSNGSLGLPAAVRPVRILQLAAEAPFADLATSLDRERWAHGLERAGLFRLPRLKAPALAALDEPAAAPDSPTGALEAPAWPAPDPGWSDAEEAAPAESQAEETAAAESPSAALESALPVAAAEPAPALPPSPEPAPQAPASSAPEGALPTATLGELYLSQGHIDEAEQIFQRILAADPGHGGALRGLERALRQRQAAAAQHPEEEAAVGPAGTSADVPSDVQAEATDVSSVGRKVSRLRRYLSVIRSGAERDVP